ncbi:hypothetical protein ACHAW5_000140 [Stephanodiscus triporus]|uniref:BTB domain-containing protein n=1 Tax=Stephanodiscus triporus TaxID=2934178 RepID=A0ABD3MK62_9STRA
MSEATAIVMFNVGGRHFEVSRTLINEISDTVLGKLVSDTWNDDPGKAVFIDRDGDIFANILNYLRYGSLQVLHHTIRLLSLVNNSIELPITIPRSMFDRELDYYGISSTQGIAEQESLAKTCQSFTDLFDRTKNKHHAFFLALEFHYQFSRYKVESKSELYRIRVNEGDRLYDFTMECRKNKYLVLDDYLMKYFGLSIHETKEKKENSKSPPSKIDFVICVKK